MRARMNISHAIARLRRAASEAGRVLTYMEVCGTHTMSAFRSGLHSLMPSNVRLLSGPGCPVCVTSQGDIDVLLELALSHRVVVCTYGDMLRVPGRLGSLESARSRGAAVRVVYSSLDAVRLAASMVDRQVVLAAVGFETTAPTTAAAVLAAESRGIENFSVLASHKLVVPAMCALLESGETLLDGFLCPGHVSVITGSEAYRPIVERYGLPCVVGGFEPALMAGALAALAEQSCADEAAVVNLYPEAVTREGNAAARRLMDRVFETSTARWRGLGELAGSGLSLRRGFGRFDARLRFRLSTPAECEPAGCLCGRVIRGSATPRDCVLFGRACTPVTPVGPCMVSGEGTCQAWFKYRRGDRLELVDEGAVR